MWINHQQPFIYAKMIRYSKIAKSNRIMTEDCLRESGYMLPQSDQVRSLIASLLENADEDFPREEAEKLLDKL